MSVVCILVFFDGHASDKHTKLDPRIKATVGAENVHVRLTIVALVGLVNIRGSQDDQTCTKIIPFELNLVTFEKGLLRHRSLELRNVEHLDSSGLALNIYSQFQQLMKPRKGIPCALVQRLQLNACQYQV